MVVKRNYEWLETAQELYNIKMMIKDLDTKEKTLSELLRSLSNDEDARGGKFMYFREQRKGSINYELIPHLKGVNLESFRKQNVIIWKLRMV